MPQSDQFHYPSGESPCPGRVLAAAWSEGTLWTAFQIEKARRNTFGVLRRTAEKREVFVADVQGYCQQPSIAPKVGGGVVIAWNEVDDNGWCIKIASMSRGADEMQEIETVHSCARLCLAPVVAVRREEIWVAWPCLEAETIRIHVARKGHEGWQYFDPVSPEGIDAFRPSLAAGAKAVFLAWDQYERGTYDVAVSQFDGTKWRAIAIPGQEDERRLCPKVILSPHGQAYATWLVLREVTDDLGIVDHLPFAPVVRIEKGKAEYLRDAGNPVDEKMVADFRNGLLASKDEPYRGYAGFRRNPWLAAADDGLLWCLWEVRFEHETGSTSGHLVGRRFVAEDGWTSPSILHSGGYAYSVVPGFVGNRLPVSFLRSEKEGLDIVDGDFVQPELGKPYDIDHAKWERWRTTHIEPGEKTPHVATVEDREYRLFWADTHCHSAFSSDAEGEVDELIHFARDAAGLDAVCIVDNDFYPHKALTEAEWRIHQEFCRHYTREGRFVVFPGWEFTYHRKGLKPDFNHRCILYPRPGWPIFRRIDPEARTDAGLFQQLKGTPAMCYPHHSTYEIIDPDLDWNVEVCSSWRVCIEENDFTIRQLQAGRKLGFIGSSDSHRAVPGLGGALTGIFAEEFTPESLFDAYKSRRIIATQGHRILMDFRAAGTFIGGEGEAPGPPKLTGRIEAPEPIEFVEILRDGACIHRMKPDGPKHDFRFTDKEAPTGEHFYFLRLKLVGDPSFNEDPAKNFLGAFIRDGRYGHNLARAKGPFAWTSPVWLTVV